MVMIGLNLILFLKYKFAYYHKKNPNITKKKTQQKIKIPTEHIKFSNNMHITSNISNVYCPGENTIHDMTSDEMSFMLLHHQKKKKCKHLQRFDFN